MPLVRPAGLSLNSPLFLAKQRVHLTLRAGGLTLDCAQRRVTLSGRPVELSALEYGLLAELSASGRRPPSYQHLLEPVWGEPGQENLRPMQTIVGKLRRKLGDDADNPTYIFTEPWEGYWMKRPMPGCLARNELLRPRILNKAVQADTVGARWRGDGAPWLGSPRLWTRL